MARGRNPCRYFAIMVEKTQLYDIITLNLYNDMKNPVPTWYKGVL